MDVALLQRWVERADSTADRLAASPTLEKIADRVADVVDRTVGQEPVRKVLDGRWLGHPLHPALTDLPIGFWTSAMLADLGGHRARRLADTFVALGIATAIPTIAAGWVDWSELDGPKRRLGLVHAACNAAATVTYASSLVFRLKGKRVRGVGAGFVAAGLATAGGYLGGRLVFEDAPEAAIVDEPAFEAEAPRLHPVIVVLTERSGRPPVADGRRT